MIIIEEDAFGVAMSKTNGTIVAKLGDYIADVDFELLDIPLFLAPTKDTPPIDEPS